MDGACPQQRGDGGNRCLACGHEGISLLSSLIEAHGFEALPRETVKHLEGKLWELRITGRDGISRAIYVTASARRVVIVRIFIKKSQKTPPAELELAWRRAKEVK